MLGQSNLADEFPSCGIRDEAATTPCAFPISDERLFPSEAENGIERIAVLRPKFPSRDLDHGMARNDIEPLEVTVGIEAMALGR